MTPQQQRREEDAARESALAERQQELRDSAAADQGHHYHPLDIKALLAETRRVIEEAKRTRLERTKEDEDG